MRILEADELGMCFGVRDALALLEQIPDPGAVTIHGELVHNGEVLAELDRRGFHRSPETDRPVPGTPVVLVTAHGISGAERQRLLAAGKELVDTTCPLVHRAHDAAQQLAREGRRVVVIGKAGHVEVEGIVGDLDAPIVVGSVADVRRWPDRRLGVMSQTTTPEAVADAILAAIRAANPDADVRAIDTICSPTKARVRAVHALIERIDVLVAVGGKGSNNTRKLVETARAAGVRAHHVESADELSARWFGPRDTVGLTAGTSTPDRTIGAVRARLFGFAAAASR